MVGAERRTRLLHDATVALQDATCRQEVEAITSRAAAALLRHAGRAMCADKGEPRRESAAGLGEAS